VLAPPVDNPEMRRAVALNLDRQAFLDIISELGAPVAQQRVPVFEAGPLAGERQEDLVVEVVVMGQGQQRAAARLGRCPIMRDVVGQSIAR
jgi:hypothetical protein